MKSEGVVMRPSVRTEFARAFVHAPAGHFHVLHAHRRRHFRHGHVEGAHLVRVEFELNLAAAAADDLDVADAVDALDALFDLLVGDLRHFAQTAWRGDGDAQDGRGVCVELLDDRLFSRLRQIGHDEVHLVAHFLRRDVGVFVEQELDEDLRDAFHRGRAQFVYAADGVDGGFDLVRHLGFDLARARAGVDHRDRDRGEVDLRKQINAEREEREDSHHRQRQYQHRREDGAADAYFS
ncbi:MAG TPA: hypothetical protein VD835_03750 [Pyrinomonadaceae bacterium]|nr:hypothetical protein [Pyrinomonadaceae bacterium]